MASLEIRLGVDSRYHKTSLLIKDGTPLWGVWVPIDFEDEEDDVIHRVRDIDVGRLDLLANHYYDNPNLWWVIARKNTIANPLTDMTSGQQLRIPQRGRVLSTLLAADERGTPPDDTI